MKEEGIMGCGRKQVDPPIGPARVEKTPHSVSEQSAGSHLVCCGVTNLSKSLI